MKNKTKVRLVNTVPYSFRLIIQNGPFQISHLLISIRKLQFNTLLNDKISELFKSQAPAELNSNGCNFLQKFKQYCGERRKYRLPAFSPFPTMFPTLSVMLKHINTYIQRKQLHRIRK